MNKDDVESKRQEKDFFQEIFYKSSDKKGNY